MKIMEVDVDRMEAKVSIKDTVAKDIKTKTIYIYTDHTTLNEVLAFCLQAISKYGVEQVDVMQGGAYGSLFHDHLMEKRHTAEKYFTINSFSVGKITV